MEAVLAVAVMVSAAVTIGGVSHPPGRGSAAPDPHTWETKARLLSADLLDELAALDAATRLNGSDIQRGIAEAETRLVQGDAQAHGLGLPKAPLAPRWQMVLRAVDSVASGTASATEGGTPAQVEPLRQSTESAIEAVLGFVAAINGNHT